jgi:signal transduction histidine kinase
MAFKSLSADAARDFLRVAFPVYYIMLLAFTCIGGAALAMPRPVDASILGAVAFTALFAWLWLMPIAHRLDDMQREGQDMQRELLQVQGRTSFIIVAQIAALIAVVVRLAVL